MSKPQNDIKVGDRVQWRDGANHLRTGTLFVIFTGYGVAEVQLPGSSFRRLPLAKLAPITDTDLVQAIAAQPQDDQEREDAIAMLRNAGSLGGAL